MILDFPIQEIKLIIKEAGKIILNYFHKPFHYSIKKNDGYVTDADLKSEAFLKENLNKIFPQASFWAEESGKSGENDFCFVIDPLDGTTNFAHGIPNFCISVALTYRNEPILGFIYDPLKEEFFYAQKDKGAFLNDQYIKVSTKNNLNESFLGLSFPCGWKDEFQQDWEAIENVRSKIFGMRLLGASALDLAYVACGRLDGAFFKHLKWWDIAAGILLIQEAGGIVSDYNNQKISFDFKSCLSANKNIHEKLIKILSNL